LTAALITRFATVKQWVILLTATAVFLAAFTLITWIIKKKVDNLIQSAQHDVMANRSEKAIRKLEGGLKYGNWQVYMKPQIFSQIGTIHYLNRNFNEAIPYLEKGFARNWVSQSMLAITYMKKNKTSKMNDVFAKAVAGSRKEPMVYALYAFCLDRIGERNKALGILKKGISKAGGDERLKDNLALLEAGKKMKMKGFGDMWYQFHLEKQENHKKAPLQSTAKVFDLNY